MPFGDRTGPMGQGSRTGRGTGYCTGNTMPGSANFGGFGRGGGRRGGFGFRQNNYGAGMFGGQGAWWNASRPAAAPTTEQELAALKNQADSLKNSLDVIEKRMKEIGQDTDK